MSLKGRVALVTGGSRGIGRATATALAQAGCDVVVNYLQAEDSAREVVKAVERLMTAIEAAFGRVDILVNNAGINPSKPLAELGLHDWQTVINQNLTSAFLVSQAVIPG